MCLKCAVSNSTGTQTFRYYPKVTGWSGLERDSFNSLNSEVEQYILNSAQNQHIFKNAIGVALLRAFSVLVKLVLPLAKAMFWVVMKLSFARYKEVKVQTETLGDIMDRCVKIFFNIGS